jgi:DNA-directed RNA polymerase subunit RPC12/RpoP
MFYVPGGSDDMATMICSDCRRYGIYWENLSGYNPYTRCPHCGGTNCQMPEEPEPEEDDEAEEVEG